MKLTDLFENIDPEGPIFDHDCNACRYLGTEAPEAGEAANGIDLYVHVKPSGITLIRRYGSHPGDYGSVPVTLDPRTGGVRTMTGTPLSPRYQRILDAAEAAGLLPTSRRQF
jgi:hypothetical protein